MMGRGVTFVDFIKEVQPRPACKQHRRDLRQETADTRGALGVTPKVSTPLRDAAGSTPRGDRRNYEQSARLRVCGGHGATLLTPPDAQRKLTTTSSEIETSRENAS